MTTKHRLSQIVSFLWETAEILRGNMDVSEPNLICGRDTLNQKGEP
jgi:hypothetical protein